MKLTVNNGNTFADLLKDNDLLVNGLTLEQCEQIAIKEGLADSNFRPFKDDSFWEDFCYRCDELGYSLKV